MLREPVRFSVNTVKNYPIRVRSAAFYDRSDRCNCRIMRRQRHSLEQETLGVAEPPTCSRRPRERNRSLRHTATKRNLPVLRLIKTRRDGTSRHLPPTPPAAPLLFLLSNDISYCIKLLQCLSDSERQACEL